MKKHVIFDLGGVIERVAPENVVRAFTELGMKNAASFYTIHAQDRLVNNFERGYTSPDEFIFYLKSLFQKEVSNEALIQAWNTNQLGVLPETLKTLESLRRMSQTKLYLLSNTNTLHTQHLKKRFNEQYNKALSEYFDKVYLSFEIGMRKPGEDIYEYVLHDIGARPQECFFIDDKEDNLSIPAAMGMRCIKHPINTDISYLVTSLGNVSQ